jgi:hypothetical protein
MCIEISHEHQQRTHAFIQYTHTVHWVDRQKNLKTVTILSGIVVATRYCVASSWHSGILHEPSYEDDPSRDLGSCVQRQSAPLIHGVYGRVCRASLFSGHDGWPCAADRRELLRRICIQSPGQSSRSWVLLGHHSNDPLAPRGRECMCVCVCCINH